jgi:hypothetical protein
MVFGVKALADFAKNGRIERAFTEAAAEGAGEGTFPRFKARFARLGGAFRQITLRTEDALSDLAKIRLADKVAQIDRAVTQEIERLSSAQSILVVGDPGAGKSGASSGCNM